MRNLFVLILSFALTACVAAPQLNYLDHSDYGRDLPAPPDAQSRAWKRDADRVVAAQKSVSEKTLDQAKFERDLRPEITAMALGANFTRANYPLTYQLLDHAEADCRAVVEEAKIYWHTDRPYMKDARVKVLVPAHSNGAYPSGHTACSRVAANILTELYPKKRKALNQRAYEIAQHRVIAGMHYPHDLTGGRQLAIWITRDMYESPVFQSDLAAARSEVK